VRTTGGEVGVACAQAQWEKGKIGHMTAKLWKTMGCV
jgi:hypothetical protein